MTLCVLRSTMRSFSQRFLRITDTRIFQNIIFANKNTRFNQLICIHSILIRSDNFKERPQTQHIDPNKTPTTKRDKQDNTKTNGTTTSMQNS